MIVVGTVGDGYRCLSPCSSLLWTLLSNAWRRSKRYSLVYGTFSSSHFSSNGILFRQSDTVVGRLIFYHGFFLPSSFLFFLFFVSYSLRSLNGTQPKPVTCSEVSAISKFMSEIWGIPSPYKSGAQKPPFSTTSKLNGNFNGLYLRNETLYKQADKRVGN